MYVPVSHMETFRRSVKAAEAEKVSWCEWMMRAAEKAMNGDATHQSSQS